LQNNKLHICIVTGEFPALTETFITTKVLELHKRGHKITVIKNEQSGQVNGSHLALVKHSGIEVLSFIDLTSVGALIKAAVRNPGSFLSSMSLKPSLFKRKYKRTLQQRLLQKYSYDIIHFEFSGLAVSYADAIKNLKAKTVVSCRGTAEKVKTISRPQRAEQLRKVFSTVNSIHCVSNDMAQTIKPFCSSPEKIFVNRPSIDASIFKRSNAYSFKSDKLQILSIGRFTFQKGYLFGLMAMEKLLAKGVQFTWTIVGDGPQQEEILYHIHALKLQHNVQLVGKKNRDEILELYNSSAVFLLTSIYEGIANVCLEAMAMELPVVATKSGGMEEVIEHEKDGLLCNTYDAEDMAYQLLSICHDVERRKVLGINAREKVLAEFTIERQADVFEKHYYSLANKI
jgi:colanic acid/amylovoran biosynthesis glycosyltransferase